MSASTRPANADFRVQNEGNVCLFFPLNARAGMWIAENVAIEENSQWWAGGLVVETNLIEAIIDGAKGAGFIVGVP